MRNVQTAKETSVVFWIIMLLLNLSSCNKSIGFKILSSESRISGVQVQDNHDQHLLPKNLPAPGLVGAHLLDGQISGCSYDQMNSSIKICRRLVNTSQMGATVEFVKFDFSPKNDFPLKTQVVSGTSQLKTGYLSTVTGNWLLSYESIPVQTELGPNYRLELAFI